MNETLKEWLWAIVWILIVIWGIGIPLVIARATYWKIHYKVTWKQVWRATWNKAKENRNSL